MSTINPNLSIPELIKLIKHSFRDCNFDEVQNILMERERIMKIGMGNLVRECDWLKKEVDLLGKNQSYADLEKCCLEEMLGRSERRCEEFVEKIEKLRGEKLDVEEKLERSRGECEELRGEKSDAYQTVEELKRQLVEANRVVQRQNVETVDELRVKKMESDKAAELYKSRLDDLEPRMLKMEATLAKVLNVNLANLVGAMDKSADVNLPDFVGNGKVNAAAGGGDAMPPQIRVTSDNYGGSGGLGLSKKGGRNLAHSGTEADGTNMVCTYPGSTPAYNSAAAASKGSVQDDEGGKSEVRGASYRFSCRCDLDIINKIKNNLDKENLETFGQSCFGHFLKINKFKFQGQLILQLLLRMDISASNKERLVFRINNSNMEFGPSDFFLITWLSFGTSEATTTSSSIHEYVFQGRPRIYLKDVEEAFLNISRDHQGRGELTLKLALLYFLYGTLLVRDRGRKKIVLRYFHLIEDLQKFNAFPWGRVAYRFLVSSILSVRVRMDGSEDTHQATNFDMYGFSYALQAWAYEMMPSVATYCASRANNFENLTPRILHWSATKIFKFDDLTKFFTLGNKTHLKNTMVKREELSTDTIPQAATLPQQKKRKLLCDKDQMCHAQPISEPSSARTPTMLPPPSTIVPTYLLRHLTRVDMGHARMECLEGRCSSSAAEDEILDTLSGQTNKRNIRDNGDDSAINWTTKTKTSASSSLPSRVEERAGDSQFRLEKLSAINEVDSDDESCSDGWIHDD